MKVQTPIREESSAAGIVPLMEERRGTRISSFAVALALASVVLFTFWTLRDVGPESAIRRFHHAAAVGDIAAMAEVTRQDVRSQSVQTLRASVRELFANGWQYDIAQVQRGNYRVLATVVYVSPDRRQAIPRVWVAEKWENEQVWRVDADKTLTLFRRRLGL
jgi:signal peptidase I